MAFLKATELTVRGMPTFIRRFMEKVEILDIQIKPGIYVDKTGESVHLQLGEINNEKAVLLTGCSNKDPSIDTSIPLMMNNNKDVYMLANMILSCEYIGPL